MEELEQDQDQEQDQPDFVLVQKSNGRFVRYRGLGAVPAEHSESVITYDDLESKRKEDLEAMYSIIAGSGPKSFLTKMAALESLVVQIERMPMVVGKEPKPVLTKPHKKVGRRAPTEFVLSAPVGLGNVVKALPPQARVVVEAIVADAEARGNDPRTNEARIHEILNRPEVKEKLATRQEPGRIFQYYRSRIMSAGILKEVQ